MYLGQFHLDLDKDYRMVVPAGFRELFAQGAYVTRGFEQNLLVMSEQDFQERSKQVAALNITDPNARLLQRLLLGNAVRLEINASGQVLLPQELMTFAGLEKEIILVGQGDYFEVWAPAQWEKQSAILLDTAANTGRFAHLDLALN
jgi:MraZ protein